LIRLHVNIDHVATLRNQRDTSYPDPAEAAKVCMSAGADGITMHLREDRRHIRDADVWRVKEVLAGRVLNLEMALTDEMADIMTELAPNTATLVPERRQERTTEGGLDLARSREGLLRLRERASKVGTRLSVFIEPSLEQVRMASEVGAAQVELHTGHYCAAALPEQAPLLDAFRQAAELAHALGLEVAAGHGLTVENVGPIAGLPHMVELNIGHSVVCEAVFHGLHGAVERLKTAISRAAPSS
jgi:pyridoxine 5-phosphate synthase